MAPTSYQVPSQYYTTSYPPSREAAATFFLSKLLMHFSCTWPFSKGMHVLFQEQGCPFPRISCMSFSKSMCQGLWTVLFQEVLPHGQGFSFCQVALFQGTPDLTNNGKVVDGHILSHLNNEMQFATLHPTLKVRSWLGLLSICLLEINPRFPFFVFISQGLAWLALAFSKA